MLWGCHSGKPSVQRSSGPPPSIARRYVGLWDEPEPRERIWEIVSGELERTREQLCAVRGEERLLSQEPVLQASIDRRNPYVDDFGFAST